MPSTKHPPSTATGNHDGLHQLLRAVVDEWYQPWRTAWAATRIADGPAVTFHPDTCRAWLTNGVADQHGIDDTFNTTELTIPAGLEELLAALDDDPQPQVWQMHPALRQVQIWRTADSDGVDGGAIITADLAIGGERVRLATLHQGYDDFTTDSATAGIDAAVEALDHIARLVNAELTAYRQTIATPNGNTVIGNWNNNQPTPTAVIVARLPSGSSVPAVIQQPGWWAVAINADDPDEAQHAAVAAARATAAG